MANAKSGPPGDPTDPDRRMMALQAFLPEFIASNPYGRFGADAVGIGSRERQGSDTEEICLKVYVARKLPLELVAPDRRVPRSVLIETASGTLEVPTDVVEMPPPRPALEDPESALRPVLGGASCSVPGSGGNGTLGAWVLDTTDETVVFISNRHVLGGLLGAPVIQPGTSDGGTLAEHRIGFVKRVVPFKPAPANPTMADCNPVDAAIGMADDPDLVGLTVIGVGPAIFDIGPAFWSRRVQKFGQTTGLTTGRIVDSSYNPLLRNVPFGPGDFRDVVFCDCFLIRAAQDIPLPGFASFGDSGSVVFGLTPEGGGVPPAVGLLFGSAGTNGIACKIQNVFSALSLDVLCSSGIPDYLESVAFGDAEHPPMRAASLLSRPERPTAGLARDVERRLSSSVPGRTAIDLLRRHRHQAFVQLLRRGDLRRAATAALTPVLQGARTSDDVLDYRLGKEDVTRIARFIALLRREGLNDVADGLERLPLASKSASGKSIGKIMKVTD